MKIDKIITILKRNGEIIMAIEAGDFRTGLTLLIDGDPWIVLDFMHVKPGKGAAILKTKMKNLRTGSTQERNFNANVKFDAAEIIRKQVQYSYSTGTEFVFMDMESFEQYELGEDKIGDNKYFLIEGMDVSIVFFEGKILDIVLPDKVEMEIAETAPAVANASATAQKDAVTNTGLKIRVPMFIKEGEHILVSTADGKYSSRA